MLGFLFGRAQKVARNNSDRTEEFRATLVEHLEELRIRIFRCIAFLAVGWTLGWYLEPPIYTSLSNQMREMVPKGIKLIEVFRNVPDAFMLKMKLSFSIGMFLVAPLIILQLWGFIAPGLKESEKKPFKILGPVSVLLFLLGGFFCWMVLPTTFGWFMTFLVDYNQSELHQDPGMLISFSTKMLLAFGLAFQLPVLVFFLGKIGVLTPDSVKQYWRHAVAIIFLLAGIITPSADVPSMLLLAIPMTILFFASVYAVKITTKEPPTNPLDRYLQKELPADEEVSEPEVLALAEEDTVDEGESR